MVSIVEYYRNLRLPVWRLSNKSAGLIYKNNVLALMTTSEQRPCQ